MGQYLAPPQEDRGMLKTFSVREALFLLVKVTRTHFADGREIKHDIPRKTRDLIKRLGLQKLFSDYREFKKPEQECQTEGSAQLQPPLT